MIFVTVGTQLPFERLIKAMDAWAAQQPQETVFAQIGQTSYQPQSMTFVANLAPQEYAQKFAAAKVVVSHVGMGTIISGLEHTKPLVLMPRLASLGEHRNDHQLATAEKFKAYAIVDIVTDAQMLASALANCLRGDDDPSHNKSHDRFGVSPRLLDALREFVRAE